jgi:signal transduction histidine kinase
MKLASHYNKVSILSNIFILLTGAVIYYFVIKSIATHQLDRDLTEEIDEVKDYVNQKRQLPKQVDFDEDQTTFTNIGTQKLPRRFFDTLYYNAREKENEPGRAVEGSIEFNKENYKVVISESKEATEYLVQVILIITFALVLILSVTVIVVNRLILSDLWEPFYKLLGQLKSFEISNHSELTLNHTNVDEFKELNEVMLNMASRAKSDYLNLKSFTENASHEMMTPLAVVTSRLDTMIQDETLNAAQLAHITEIYGSIGKLSRLNQSLLLLVKIENNMINDQDYINLKTIVAEKLIQFQELIQGKNLSVDYQLTERKIFASKYLMDILLNNLFSNAVRHNLQDGKMKIELTENRLILKNTGDKMPLAEEVIFERFKKGKYSEGVGLGLTLVKNICLHYGFQISYNYQDQWHMFIVDFELIKTHSVPQAV